jgi:hypothetical protein
MIVLMLANHRIQERRRLTRRNFSVLVVMSDKSQEQKTGHSALSANDANMSGVLRWKEISHLSETFAILGDAMSTLSN